jgi:hypothetical protein
MKINCRIRFTHLILVVALTAVGGCRKKEEKVKILENLSIPETHQNAQKNESPKNILPKKSMDYVVQNLTDEEKRKLAELLSTMGPFLESPEAKNEPASLGHLFTQEIYKKLQGNFVWGYLYNQGVKIEGSEIGIDVIKGIDGTQEYIQRISSYIKSALQESGYRINPEARYRMGICVVYVQKEFVREPYSCPGVVSEVYFSDRIKKKGFFYRFSIGKKEGLEQGLEVYGKFVVHIMEKLKVT